MSTAGDRAALRGKVLRNPVALLAFGLGAGLVPVAPGTVGSLLGVALAWLTLPLAIHWQFVVAISLIVAGVWLCAAASSLRTSAVPKSRP